MEMDVFVSAQKEALRQKAIMVGITEMAASQLKNKVQDWRYYQGKKRVIDGKTFNLLFIRVKSSTYGYYSISAKYVFVLDKKHVRKGVRLNMLEEIDEWSGWAIYIPNKFIRAKLVHIEKKEKYMEAILKEPCESSKFAGLEFE